jgi:hypothetical protein
MMLGAWFESLKQQIGLALVSIVTGRNIAAFQLRRP